jgi:Na+-transporting NADH:ubiquinone oxidoreductase subunit NqrB
MSFASAVIASRLPFFANPVLADARYFQIATLATLAGIYIIGFDLGATPAQAVVTLAAALTTQLACARLTGTAFDWRSPLITGLSLTLLLRTHAPGLWLAAGVLAIGSKYVLRARGKHLFNPATFAIAALLIASPDVWVSPGQWGSAVWLSLLLACCAGLVLQRAERADTALAFLGTYVGILLLRAYALGDPPTIPLHQLQSGALLLFGFFMITDPRSTPDRRLCRVAFAAAVAGLGYWLQFRWQLRPGLYFALFALSPLTPLLDRLLPAPRFVWRGEPSRPSIVEA